MMSILLLTLLSWLHSHPEISRMSLLPVANVVSSPVQNFVFTEEFREHAVVVGPDWKSRVKVAFVKGPAAFTTDDGATVCVFAVVSVVTSKRVAQSSWLELQKALPVAGQE